MIELLRRALAVPWGDDEVRHITLPAPAAAAESILDHAPTGPAVFWAPAGGEPSAGSGAAAVVAGSGAARGEQVAAGAGRLWARLRGHAPPGVEPLAPRLFGGFAFLPGDAAPEWAGFGEARFVLPRVLYVGGGEPRLVVAVTAAELERDGPARLLDDVARAVDALDRPPAQAPAPAGGDHGPLAPDADARAEWTRAVESIQRRIRDGRAEKIVAARARCVRLERRPPLGAVLRRLAAVPAAARFALRFDAATFVGAAPERLVCRRGSAVRSEALAGSVAAGGDDRAEALLASRKDQAEHAYVVRAIAETLGPLCERLDHPPEPAVRRMGPVLHLHTGFEGALSRPVPALELALRLHPTPAVGGTPTAAALDWIAREEPGARGWYAAPVGWFGPDGDGDFVVALRSALLSGTDARVYAGAGIVRESTADAELAETEVKMRAMLDALGAGR